MTKLQKQEHLKALVDYYGADILDSEAYHQSDKYLQHNNVSTLEHTISVACMCIIISRALRIKSDEMSLVRGALLHDFFLYDWHSPKSTRPPHHPTHHGSYALSNASELFSINPIEADMIKEHMFPVTIKPPKHRETYILTIADKVCHSIENIPAVGSESGFGTETAQRLCRRIRQAGIIPVDKILIGSEC